MVGQLPVKLASVSSLSGRLLVVHSGCGGKSSDDDAGRRGIQRAPDRLRPEDATEDRGSELNFEGSLLVATTIPAGLGFLCGALANGFPARRRWLVPLGFALTGVSLTLALIVEIVH